VTLTGVRVILALLFALAPSVGSAFEVPRFVTAVPTGHFAGVSVPCGALSDARKSAVSDVVRQVLGTMGARYDVQHVSLTSGDPRKPLHEISDRLSGVSHGIVMDVERRIVKSSWGTDSLGRCLCFILVHYPEEKIREMRRLSRGAKVVAEVISDEGSVARLRVTEVNGVPVVLSCAEVTVRKKYRFAKAIDFFVMDVPQGSEESYSIGIGPVRVCGNSIDFSLKLGQSGLSLKDYLLGAEVTHTALIKGFDEVGRVVSVRVGFEE